MSYLASKFKLTKFFKILINTLIKTLSKLMISTTHFNFHENLIETVVPYVNDADEEIGEEVANAIGELFKTDRKGDKVLNIVRKIAAIVRYVYPHTFIFRKLEYPG